MSLSTKSTGGALFVDTTNPDAKLRPYANVTFKGSKPNSNSPLGATLHRANYNYVSPRLVRTGYAADLSPIYGPQTVNESVTVTMAYDPNRTDTEAKALLAAGIADLLATDHAVRTAFFNIYLNG